jgi:hypothetical protein
MLREMIAACRTTLISLALVWTLQVGADFDPSWYLAQGGDFNCADFSSQAQAQAVLRADPSDPFGLDRDRDGIACERNLGARDTERVAR